jgi:hypothetical protein
MSSDAKLGLVVGLGLVLLIAQVFYRERAGALSARNSGSMQSTSARAPSGPPSLPETNPFIPTAEPTRRAN